MAKDVLAPELLPGRSAAELQQWIAAGGPAEYRATALLWVGLLPAADSRVSGFQRISDEFALVYALSPLVDGTRHDSQGPHRDDAALRWVAAHDAAAAARAARKSKAPGSRGAVAAALTQQRELEPWALAQYELVRQDVNRQLVALHQRAIAESTPAPSREPARVPVTLH